MYKQMSTGRHKSRHVFLSKFDFSVFNRHDVNNFNNCQLFFVCYFRQDFLFNSLFFLRLHIFWMSLGNENRI